MTALPFAGSIGTVSFFRHALALDERRVKFQPEYRKFDAEETRDIPLGQAEGKDRCGHPDNNATLPRAKEIWFMGCHSDVGGGNDLDDQSSLANIPFRWMLREAEHCGLLIGKVGLLLCDPITRIPEVRIALETMVSASIYSIIASRDEVPQRYPSPKERALIETSVGSDSLHKLIDLAASADTADIQEEKDDRLRSKKESLTGMLYRALEYVPRMPLKIWRPKDGIYEEVPGMTG